MDIDATMNTNLLHKINIISFWLMLVINSGNPQLLLLYLAAAFIL